jgi:hypothetical protein
MVNPYRLNIAPRVLHSEKLPRAVTADTFCDCSPSNGQPFPNPVRFYKSRSQEKKLPLVLEVFLFRSPLK